MQHIETIELGSSQASITFSSIPQDYTDLKILISARSDKTTGSFADLEVSPNGTATNSSIRLIGLGSTAESDSNNSQGVISNDSNTASTFGNASIYISNYTSSNDKSISSDSVSENNATSATQALVASLWQNSAAITSVEVTTDDGTQDFLSGSTFSLYGITAGSDGTTTVS